VVATYQNRQRWRLTAGDRNALTVDGSREPVDARIGVVVEQCYMEKVERGAVMKTASTSDLLDCAKAEMLTRAHPKWQGYTIKHKIEIRFAYVSPVDGATHDSQDAPTVIPRRRGTFA
jgi:hypothetical protein